MIDDMLQSRVFSEKVLVNLFRRKRALKFVLKMNRLFLGGKRVEGLYSEERFIKSRYEAPDIRVRIYKPLNAKTSELPAMLFIHGGNYMMGLPEQFSDTIRNFMDTEPCLIIAPDYRKAIDAPYPAALNDCYDTLLWLKEHARIYGARDDKFIVAGHSAGGGLTTAVVLKAMHSKDVDIAFQMPVYPMLDDRLPSATTEEQASIVGTNILGWNSYLQGLEKIPVYAAPARAKRYSGLPPTITFVGNLDPFRDETVSFVKKLEKANVPVKFQLFDAAFYGFDLFGSSTKKEINKVADKFLFDNYREYVKAYLS